ncbi:barA sensory histidine kinase [Vibrio ishigakensis]|uniref:BarA sensory histidine kinase n=1 Tax=Vibrio ishigakensis TaxID=1481914 RepID=A0A0B8NWP4_9VIBR|nr:barA sensory histidine kinase [Vibrio ishigakensis]
MTRYGLRARVITLTLAPTLIVGRAIERLFHFKSLQRP